jgi:hypothetical protein
MRISHTIKAAALALGLTMGAAAAPAHAGDYLGVSATSAQLHVVNGSKFMCFYVYLPAASNYMWCLPASDPASSFVADIVNTASAKGKTIDVSCISCQSLPGDSRWTDTMWLPEFVMVNDSHNRQ